MPPPRAWRPAPRAAADPRSGAASASTSFSRSASSTSRSHKPMRYDSSASMRAAVQIISLALPAPTTRGSRWVPPRSGRMPYLCSSSPTLAPRAKHADVARQRELQARAERVAAHRRDRRIPRFFEPRVGILHAQDPRDRRIGVGVGFVRREHVGCAPAAGEHRRVDTRRERAAVADDDERADRRVVLDLLAERAHLVPHLDGEAVQLVGAVHPQPGDVAVTRELERLHGGRG